MISKNRFEVLVRITPHTREEKRIVLINQRIKGKDIVHSSLVLLALEPKLDKALFTVGFNHDGIAQLLRIIFHVSLLVRYGIYEKFKATRQSRGQVSIL